MIIGRQVERRWSLGWPDVPVALTLDVPSGPAWAGLHVRFRPHSFPPVCLGVGDPESP
jgi:hypothetical protein